MLNELFRCLCAAGLFMIFMGASPWVWGEPVTTIRDNGDPANRVDLVILGDGFTASEMEQWVSIIEGGIDEFFINEPFNEYRNYINVHRVDVISNESGVDHPELGVYKDTAFDATYNCAGIQRLICVNTSKIYAVLSNSVQPNQMDIVLVMVNDLEYGGSGGAVAVASLHEDALELVLHELGHSFGLLADEYIDTSVSCDNTSEPPEPNVTMQTDRSLIKWNTGGGPPAGWIEFSTLIPTTGVTLGVPGLYEGAKYCSSGLYRPTYDSKMRTLYQPYEQINEEQLIKRIYNWVSPMDSSSPVGSDITVAKGESSIFQVEVPVPLTHSLDVTWYVDSLPEGAGLQFALDSTALNVGFHNVEVVIQDPVDKVRHDPVGVLVENRIWTVEITPGDTDGDGVLDTVDNCTLIPNPDQRDTNGDGYGNICDPDLNNSGAVNFADLNIMKSVFFTADADADLNGDGAVNFADLNIIKAMFFQPPGPSGLVP